MRKFPSINQVNRVPEIFSVKEVVAVEKLHGTNMRIGFPAGISSIEEVQFGGRNEEFGTGENGSFFGGRPVAWFKERPELLRKALEVFGSYGFNDVTLYGEACGSSIQKEVKYAPPGEVIFRAFALCVGDNFLRSFDLFVEICEKIGMPYAREVWRGPPSLEAFDALIDKVSAEGLANGIADETNIAEGVVIQSNPLLRTTFGEYLIIKHKSEKFKEQIKVEKGQQPDTSAADAFAASVVTQGRILNVLGHLRASGVQVVDGMEDMKALVPALVTDIQKECGSEWTESTSLGATDALIRKAIQKTAGNVYRRMLNETAAKAST